MTTNDFTTNLLTSVYMNIEISGVHVQYVVGDDDHPPWAYTVGLEEYGVPEVIVFGLPPDAAANVLNALHDQIAGRYTPKVGRDQEWQIRGVPVRFLRIPLDVRRSDLFAVAHQWREESGDPTDLDALQLVWPDGDHRFPWDPGFDDQLRSLQPILEDGQRP